MCSFKSFWVLRPEQPGCSPRIIHFPGVHSHEEIAARAGLRERLTASPHDGWAARVEYTPDWDLDLASPEAWTFVLDEARRPEWWDADCDDRARSACWAAIEAMFTTTDGRLDLAEARFLHRVRRSVRNVCLP